jgi:cobalt-zinc-cadmium efflux system outer membrane protein
MSRRPLAALLALALAASAARAQAPNQPEPGSPERTYALDDALRLIRNDPRLQSAEQDVIIAESRVTEAQLRFLPELGLQASASKYKALYPFALSQDFRGILLFPSKDDNIYSGRGYFNLPLYEGGRTLNTYRLAQAAEKQALASRDSVKMDLNMQVKEAFYRLLLAQERAAVSDEELQTVERAAADGGMGPWEAVEAEALLAAARSRSAEAGHDLGSARLAFLKSLNLELDTPFHVIGALTSGALKVEVERAVLWAMELRPELQSQTYKAQMDSIGVNLAFGRRYPTVFVAGDYELTAQDFPLNKNNWDVGVGIKLPFSYDLWSQLKQKRAEQRQGQLARSDLQDRVRLEVRQAAESLAFWQDEMPRREKQWRRIQQLYDAASGKAGGAMSRLRAREGVLELRLAHLTAVTEHLLARARLERAVGREIAP